MSESKGIMMFNCGTDMIIRAIVALYSIRKFYNGAITFYVEDPCPIEFEKVLKDYNCEVIHLNESKDAPLIKKVSLFNNPPYDKTLFLDLDVVVADKIDEMFDSLNEVDVCIPHFENKYTMLGPKENLCSNRVKKYEGYIDNSFIQEALNNHEAINTGVISFKKSEQWNSFAKDWISVAKKGEEIKAVLPDESAFQVLYPSINRWGLKIKIISGSYNIYVLSEKEYDYPKIYHFCGNKHCTIDTPLSIVWRNAFEEMKLNNISNINSFLQYADKRLSEYLKGNSVFYKKENKINPRPKEIERGGIRSLNIDKNDDSALRNLYGRRDADIKLEFNQHIPFFFSREGAEIDLVGQYKGRSIFLICNGPSFAALNKELLRKPGVMTFGINNGPKSFRPDFWTCVDDPVRFLKSIWLDPKITKFVPQAHFEKPIFDNEKWETINVKVGECPNVIGYRRNEKFHAKRFLIEPHINWGCSADSGGGRTVMLPALRICYLLGFRKIYLLGCDMKMTETYTYHFDEQRTRGAVNCNNSTYDRLKSQYLPQLKPIFEEAGLNVFNCNPDSELKVFPFVSFDDAVKEATEKLGDIENERTYGMYSVGDEKNQFKNEPPDTQKANLEVLNQIKQGNIDIIKEVIVPPKQPKHPKNIIPQVSSQPLQLNIQKQIPVQPQQKPNPVPVVIRAQNIPEVKPQQFNVHKINLVQMNPAEIETVSQVQRKVPPLITRPPNQR
jgi:hypothetical protein